MREARTPRVRGVLFALVIVLLSVTAAHAKVPPSSIKTQSGPAIKDEPFAIIVEFNLAGADIGEEHTGLGEELTDHVAAYPGTRLIRSQELPITLRQVEEGVYRGEVIFPSEGTWRIWTLPHVSHRQSVIMMHTNFVEIEVLEERPPGSPAAAIVLGAVVLTVAAVLVSRRRTPSRIQA